MIPIGDDNPTSRPALVTVLIVVGAAFVFLFVQPDSPPRAIEFLYAQAAIPCEIATGSPLSASEIGEGPCRADGEAPVFADKQVVFSVLASIFFHGGIIHLVGNLWVLWIFGNNVEDVMGHLGYAAFYLLAGVLATFAHVALNPGSTIPVVGASGAIAGVMGAYLVLFPTARVTSLIPPFIFFPISVPAVLFLGLWFLGQFALAGQATAIAWEAHVGGFVVGMIGGAMLRRRRGRRRRRQRRL